MQHVRVAEEPPAVLARPVALGHRGVAVEAVPARTSGEAESGERPELVGGERLGRREVQRGGARVRGEAGEHRQLVGQRLPRRRAGRHHDVLTGVRQRRRPSAWWLQGCRTPRSTNAARTSGGTQSGHSTGRPGRGGRWTAWRSGPSPHRTGGPVGDVMRFRPVRRPPQRLGPGPRQHPAEQDPAAPGPRAYLRPRDAPPARPFPPPTVFEVGTSVRRSGRRRDRLRRYPGHLRPRRLPALRPRLPGQQHHEEALLRPPHPRCACSTSRRSSTSSPAWPPLRSRPPRPRRREQPERLVEPVLRRRGRGRPWPRSAGPGRRSGMSSSTYLQPHGVVGRHRHLAPLGRIRRGAAVPSSPTRPLTLAAAPAPSKRLPQRVHRAVVAGPECPVRRAAVGVGDLQPLGPPAVEHVDDDDHLGQRRRVEPLVARARGRARRSPVQHRDGEFRGARRLRPAQRRQRLGRVRCGGPAQQVRPAPRRPGWQR